MVMPSGAYEITAASFRTKERATNVAESLAAAGLPVSARADLSGQWHRVVVGPFRSSDEARAAQEKLEARGFGGTYISLNGPAAR
jgi:cell division protein FtsN